MESTKSRKLNTRQARELENLLLRARGTITTLISDWEQKEFGDTYTYRCAKCGSTNYLYPHALHMERAHGVTNYFKTISELDGKASKTNHLQ